jgi:hypothetical protein
MSTTVTLCFDNGLQLNPAIVHVDFELEAMNILQEIFCVSLRILLTIPATVESAEKSFSKLKLIKNCLSTMSQTRLVDLAGERHFRIFPAIYSWLPVQNPRLSQHLSVITCKVLYEFVLVN